jgi:hypothetical protein
MLMAGLDQQHVRHKLNGKGHGKPNGERLSFGITPLIG